MLSKTKLTFAMCCGLIFPQLAWSEDLGSAVQNPISSLISVPFKFSFDNGASNGDANVLSINPVFPVTVGDWNLVSRFIVPLYDAPGGVAGLPGNPGIGDPSQTGRATGLGDINYTLFFSPVKPVNGWIWGLGPSITADTATDERLGSGKWSGGLSAVALNQPGWGTYGGLVRHLWSFAGDSSRQDVNQTLLEPFINYNLDNGWYLISDMVITYNWEAPSGDRLLLPVGGGAGKITKWGSQPVNLRAEAYYNVERPSSAPEWQVGFTVQLLFPKG
ncbi:neuromedin U [Ruegeria sp. AU67]|uniref:neuromedin U n=1 Tax=Ruegeria sp. AU67 TaxID=2108530 RepID=UPI000D69D714|nr:neuromedin U [Ruegeria sp. AU67]